MRRMYWLLVFIAFPTISIKAQTPDPRLNGYRVAPGFKVEIAATEPLVINPVAMTFGPDARLYVIEWTSGDGPNDHIKVLDDTDNDGVFDKASIYMDKLELPAGLLFWDGWTYISLGHDVVRFKDADGDGKFEKRESIATGFGNDNSHHRVSGLTMGPDGWIYITTGDSDARAKGSDGSTATVLRCGGVFRCKPDGSHMEMVAYGMRNPFGNVAFDDEFHIFHTDNDNEGSPGFTGCRILHVVEGGDYGWRLREGARCCQPDFERATWNGGRPGRLGWITETGRGAPAGLCVLNSGAFPPSTRNLLVYPDVFRKLVRAYKVKESGATYAVDKEFELLASDDPLFRPDDAEMGPDGALYILDWRTDSGGAGKLSGNGQFGWIYKLTWGGTKEEPARKTLDKDRFVKAASFEDAMLATVLRADKAVDFPMRRFAALELIRRVRMRPLDDKARDRLLQVVPTPLAISVLLADRTTEELMQDNWPMTFEQLRGRPAEDLKVRRIALELASRFIRRAKPYPFRVLLEAEHSDPQMARSYAMMLGRLTFLPLEAAPDAQPAPSREELEKREGELRGRGLAVMQTRIRMLNKQIANKAKSPGDAALVAKLENEEAEIQKLEAELLKATPQTYIASLLLKEAEKNASADPFLRDASTRGLERLGKPGLDTLLAAIKSGDKQKTEVALYALQGWRTLEGRDALIAEATTSDPIPVTARVGLFKALRELGPAVPPESLTDWLKNRPEADGPARAEALRVLGAMKARAALALGNLLPALLGDKNTDVRKAALGVAADIRSDELKKTLISMIGSADRGADERSLILAALRGYEAKDLTSLLTDELAKATSNEFKADLLRTIAASDYRAGAKQAETFLSDKDQNLRAVAITILGQKPETALLVAHRFNEGKLPAEDLSRVVEAIRGHATPEIQAATQAMLKSKLLAAPTGEDARRLRDFVGRRGNPNRGKALFLDGKKGGCATCHKLEGVGTAIGPDLTKVYETLTFDKRVESILEPSKEIKEGYNTFKVATTDGRTLSGLLVADTPDGITLKDAQGKEVKIPAKEVDQKGPDKLSLMPAGVVGHLSLDELADLLAFLGDRNAQESLRSNGK